MHDDSLASAGRETGVWNRACFSNNRGPEPSPDWRPSGKWDREPLKGLGTRSRHCSADPSRRRALPRTATALRARSSHLPRRFFHHHNASSRTPPSAFPSFENRRGQPTATRALRKKWASEIRPSLAQCRRHFHPRLRQPAVGRSFLPSFENVSFLPSRDLPKPPFPQPLSHLPPNAPPCPPGFFSTPSYNQVESGHIHSPRSGPPTPHQIGFDSHF